MSMPYAVALSFAGEDRDYVRGVAARLEELGITFFYADLQGDELWGEDLVAYLDRVYRSESAYVVVFISQAYVSKIWTRHEFRSALAAAVSRLPAPYLLPVRFDDSDTPGLPPTIGYQDGRTSRPAEIADAIARKLALTGTEAPAVVTKSGYRPFPVAEVEELERLLDRREARTPVDDAIAVQARDERIRTLVARLRSHAGPRAGDVVCGVKLDRIIGRGHYSTVWEGTRKSDGHKRAVKIFDSDRLAVGTAVRQFRRGVKAMQHLEATGRRPESIVAIDESEPSLLAFSMPHLPNGDLSGIKEHGWTLVRKLSIFEGVCDAVAFAHEHDVFHRDIKPSNIILDARQEPVLTDFDLADPVFLHTLSIREPGTVWYSAPEQLSRLGRRDPTGDVYSLGRLLAFLVLERDPQLEIQEIPDVSEFASNADVTIRSLRRIVRKCTCRNPDRRYRTVDLLKRDLERVKKGNSRVGAPSPPTPHALVGTTILIIACATAIGLACKPTRAYRLVGSETVIETIVEPHRGYLEKQLRVKIAKPARIGSEPALMSLLEDSTIDGAMMSRNPDDQIAREPRYRDDAVVFVTVAIGEIVIVSHETNPARRIRVEDLRRLLLVPPGAQSPALMHWGDVGVTDQAWQRQRIEVFLPARMSQVESGTVKLIERCLRPSSDYRIWEFLENAAGRTPWIQAIPDSFVAVRPTALGVTERTFVHNSNVRILDVTSGVDGGGDIVVRMKRPLVLAARVGPKGVDRRMLKLLTILLSDEMQRKFQAAGLERLSDDELGSQRDVLKTLAPVDSEPGVQVFQRKLPLVECWGVQRDSS